MAKLLLKTATNALLVTNGVYAYYCDNDSCSETQYCCGANVCCGTVAVWQMWYFWCGIAVLLLLLLSCAGLCRYKYHTRTVIILRDKPVYARLNDPGYTYTDAKNLPFAEEQYSETKPITAGHEKQGSNSSATTGHIQPSHQVLTGNSLSFSI